MDYLKYNLTPLDEVKGEEPKTESEKAARAELNRHRQETQRYKQKYFEYYDDVKSITAKTGDYLLMVRISSNSFRIQKAHHTVRFFK